MTLIQKYAWVIETLQRLGPLSLKDLNKEWVSLEVTDGMPILRQTFDRWKNGILDMFGVVIGCQLNNGYKYYIENPEVLDDKSLQTWILNSFSALNTVAEYVSLEKRILVEEIPSSSKYLTDILYAMKHNQVLQMTYRNFSYKTESNSFLVEPYCIRLFQKRWYLLGHSIYDDRMRVYCLDRIRQVHLTEETFTMPDCFDAQAWFSPYFGVVVEQEKNAERIVLRVNKIHREYMRTLPLHHTQKEIATADSYSDFELNLCPTYDFCMELLKLGHMVEVIEPQTLRLRMRHQIKEMWEMYKEK